MVKLAETGKVARGKTTGCNAFFVLTGAMVEEYGISDAFLAPVVARGTAEGLLRDDDATEWFLDIKEPKATLARSKEGRRALRYVEAGERTTVTPKRGRDTKPRPISRLSSVSGRRLWYNLGLGKPPAAFLSIFADRRAAFYENGGRFFARNNFAYYTPSEARHLRPVLAWMACSWFGLYQERYGHRAGGGALQFLTGDYKAATVPDFSVMDGADLDRWAVAWREYNKDMDRDRLDCTVLRLAGLTDPEADGVRDALRRMADARRSKKSV